MGTNVPVIDLQIHKSYPGYVEFKSTLNVKQHDYQTVELSTQVQKNGKLTIPFELIEHKGRNAKIRIRW